MIKKYNARTDLSTIMNSHGSLGAMLMDCAAAVSQYIETIEIDYDGQSKVARICWDVPTASDAQATISLAMTTETYVTATFVSHSGKDTEYAAIKFCGNEAATFAKEACITQSLDLSSFLETVKNMKDTKFMV